MAGLLMQLHTSFLDDTCARSRDKRLEEPWEEAQHWHLLWTVCDRIGIFRCLENGSRSAKEIGTELDINVHMVCRILQLLTDTGYVRNTGDGFFRLTHVPHLPRMLETWSSMEGLDLEVCVDKMIAALRSGDVPFHRIYSANFVTFVCTR